MAVDTPEHVRIDYALADLGSRVAAFAIDAAIVAAGLSVVALALTGAGGLGSLAESFTATALVLAGFLAQWGYFMLLEGLGGGRTPGKRALGLRVVHAGGEPLSLRGAVLRNLLRVVDLQPAPSGLAGLACILVSRRAQRLGDLVAGTMVVRDAAGGDLIAAAAIPPARVGRPVLGPARFELLAGYVARREGLSGQVRRRVSGSVLSALRPALGDDAAPAGLTADEFLVRLHADEAPRHAARGGASLQVAAMAGERRAEWARYAQLARKGARHGLGGLSEHEVRSFGRLYRGVAADLARARTYGAGPELLGALQRWVGAGHNLLYRRSRRIAFRLGRWLAVDFPRAVRLHRVPVLLATALFFGPAGATFAAVRGDPLLGRALVGPALLTRAENTEKGDLSARYLERDVGIAEMPVLSSALTTNNVGVTFLAFAGGLLAGVGTLAVLLLNGFSIGAALGAYANEGVLGVILAFVFPHGFIELTAICIAGGAGFGLGSALLAPGRLTRAEALRARARAFLTLLGGAAVMLVVAGFVEGFYSPSALPAAAKFAFGGATAALLATYFGLAGRRGAPAAGAVEAAPGIR